MTIIVGGLERKTSTLASEKARLTAIAKTDPRPGIFACEELALALAGRLFLLRDSSASYRIGCGCSAVVLAFGNTVAPGFPPADIGNCDLSCGGKPGRIQGRSTTYERRCKLGHRIHHQVW